MHRHLRLGDLALLSTLAACASRPELRITLEIEEGVDPADVLVEVLREPADDVPFLTCSPGFNVLGGRLQCVPKHGLGRTERLEARQDGRLLTYGPVPVTRRGPSGYRVEAVTVRLPTELLEIREGRSSQSAPADGDDAAAYVHYTSRESRELFEPPLEPPLPPVHAIPVPLGRSWPDQLVIRPRRERLGERRLIGAIWSGLREDRPGPPGSYDPSREASWAGWRWRRHSDGTDRLEHVPSGGEIVGGASEGPGTISLPLDRRLPLPIAPAPEDGGGEAAREETLEVIVVPAAEAGGLGSRERGTRYGEDQDWEDAREGTLGESYWSLPIERWRALADREAAPPGLEMEFGQGAECGAPALEGRPLVCALLRRTGQLPELLLLAAAWRETDTMVWALAYRLVSRDP